MRHFVFLALSTLLLGDDALGLLDDLSNASKIITKTKLNINKTPAVVSVLHTNELQKLGFTTLFEALEAVPGIETSMSIGGAKQINMRGNKSLVTDKIKFMLDGVSINAELSGANLFYLNMPLENIERIEVIRGPASALYGSFAHIGLINVITKASTHKSGVVFLRGSSQGSKNLGFTQHINSEDIKVALTGSLEHNEKTREYENYSILPGKHNSYEDFSAQEIGMNAAFKRDFSFLSKYLELDSQSYYGYSSWPIVQDPKNLKHTSWINELRYTPKISQTLDLDLKLGYKEYSFGGESRMRPFSAQEQTLYPPYDLLAGGNYKEKTLYTDLAANNNYGMHAFSFGTYLAKTTVKDPQQLTNNPFISEEILYAIDEGGLKNRVDRKHYALYFSDVMSLSKEWMACVGLRYDDYSDVDIALSPKISLLYAYDERQSYKLMYQNSFRAPTFVELYGKETPFIGDENLKSETIDTIEFAYSFEQSYERWININFFYSEMQNFIYRDPAFRLKNGLDASSYGAELEFKTPIFDKTMLQANYSYVHSEDKKGLQTPLIANHLANIMISYQLCRDWYTGSRLRYVGERGREALDSREPLDAYTTFDQTVTFMYDDFLFQASVKNIFNADVRYIAPIGNGFTSGTYMDDLERNGRVFWLSVQWAFQ